jgi:M6 family metalloprotease-like protein
LTFIILMGSSLIPVVNEYGMEEETGTSTGAGITGGEAGTREGEVGETPGADADPVIPGDALPIPRSDCSLTPLVHSSPALPPEATVTRGRVQGSKEMILLGCNYSDLDPKGQHDAAFMEQRSLDMSDYYQETSYGMVSLNGTWGGWHAVPQTRAYYGADSVDKNDVNVNSLITHAVGVADPYVDFSKFDANSDGYIDYLIVVHAGGDQAITGDSDDIWSHRGYNIQTPLVDGVRVGYYVIVAEDDALGVYVHEFGHFFGLPDLYDTDYTSDGIGIWGLMAAGPHLDNGDTPAHFCAWSKAFLGWVEPIEVTENLIDHIIVPVETNQVVYRLSVSTKEYFLIENRQRVGYDAYLPGDGLLIWHIDDSVGSLEWRATASSYGTSTTASAASSGTTCRTPRATRGWTWRRTARHSTSTRATPRATTTRAIPPTCGCWSRRASTRSRIPTATLTAAP